MTPYDRKNGDIFEKGFQKRKDLGGVWLKSQHSLLHEYQSRQRRFVEVIDCNKQMAVSSL